MKPRNSLALLVAVLSTGWLFPLWLAVELYLSFWQVEGWPLLLGKHPANSFEFFAFASNCFKVAVIWLGLVISFWSYVGYTAYDRARAT